MGGLATSPLPSRGVPNASKRGAKSEQAHKRADWLHHPPPSGVQGGPQRFNAEDKITSGPPMGGLATLLVPSRGPQRFKAGGRIRSGPQMDELATSPPPSRGVPNASKRGTKSQVVHQRADWLHYLCRLGGSPTFQSGGQNQNRPTNGRIGSITRAVWGVPNVSKRGTKSEEADKWAYCLHHPCCLGRSPALQRGAQNQKWPTNGQLSPFPEPPPQFWGAQPIPPPPK